MSTRLKAILGSRFDVIHYHNISLIGGPKILHFGQGIKLYTLHEYWLLCPTHLLFKYNRKPCTHQHCFACTLAYKRPPYRRGLGACRAGSLEAETTQQAPAYRGHRRDCVHRAWGRS